MKHPQHQEILVDLAYHRLLNGTGPCARRSGHRVSAVAMIKAVLPGMRARVGSGYYSAAKSALRD